MVNQFIWIRRTHKTIKKKNIQGGPKKLPPYILLFIVLLYVFIFTNNIPYEVKLCPTTYIEAQTKIVCQQVVQKNYNTVKAPEHHYVTMVKHNSNACLCLYISNSSSIQLPDSQVNNCLMCPSWIWTTAFNRGRHWSTALLMSCWSRLVQQVHSVLEIIQSCRSVLAIRRTEMRDIPVKIFNISGTCWTLGCLLDCISVQLHAQYPVPFWQSSAIRYWLSERSSLLCQSCAENLLTELTAHFLLENSLQMRFAPHPFSWRRSLIDSLSSFVKGMFINKLWPNKDVALMTLPCVSCRVGSLHLLCSSFETLGNICTKFTHISQKWFYFSVHYTFYLHISLGRCNWLRCRGQFILAHTVVISFVRFSSEVKTKYKILFSLVGSQTCCSK